MGYRSALVGTSTEVLAVGLAKKPIAMILDATLPEVGGIEVTARVRQCGFNLPIMIMTRSTSRDEELASLLAGADGYMVTPPDAAILTARLGLAVRRCTEVRPLVIHLGALTLDRLEGVATFQDRRLPLSPIELRLLYHLGVNVGRVASLADLACRVWGHPLPTATNTYRVHLQRLRQKLESCGSGVRIHTLHKEGYLLSATSSLAEGR